MLNFGKTKTHSLRLKTRLNQRFPSTYTTAAGWGIGALHCTIFAMTKKSRKKKLLELGRELELFYHFERSFVPYLLILGKLCALRNLLPLLQDHVSEKEIEQVLLLMEVLRKCSELMENRTN